MGLIAKCRICGSKVSITDKDVYSLGEHLLKMHPQLNMTHFSFDNNDTIKKRKSPPTSKIKRSKTSVISSLVKQSTTLLKRKTDKLPTKSKKDLYKTTVETWRPGITPMTCPKCHTTDNPYIRKRRHKIAYNSLGAYFLMGCWPLCFLPILMCGKSTIVLCCKKCGYCFGTYDPKNGEIIPASEDSMIEIPNIC